jgi:coenzyme Q-binding protein COQ10
MPKFTETKKYNHSASQMRDMIMDVKKYPDFLPWCMGARLYKIEEDHFYADLIIGFKMFRERFTSHVHHDETSVKIEYIKGPLKYLHNHWSFNDLPEGGCEVEFMVDFEFKNKIFETLVGGFFTEAVTRMVQAFEKRADELYS